MRNAVRKLRSTTDKAEAAAMYPGVTKILDKLAKTNEGAYKCCCGKALYPAARKKI